MTCSCHLAVAGLALTTLAAAVPAGAQDLTYTTTTKMEISGTLGRILSLVSDVDKPMVEKTFFQGSRVRKDQDQSSSIMDWSAGVLTLLDHKERTFTRMDFAQMAEQMAGAVQEERPEAEAPDMEVTVTTDRTGKTETIAGYAAEQVVLVIEMKPKNATEGEAAAPPTTALVTEMWLSPDFPEYRMMQQMEGEAAERLREGSAQGMAQAMGALAASDPAMKEGWEKNLEAMKGLQGTVLRSTTHFVTVPPGATLDKQKVLDSAGEKVQEGGGVAQGAANAARQALGGLAGRFGRGRQQQEAAPATPTQAVIMRVKSEISDVGTGAVDPAVFGVPAGYTEKTPPGKG